MNNIPQGYKQTELGIIPEDWEVKKICEGLADVKSGKRLPNGYYVTDQHTNHPYIRVIDMYDGGIDTSNLMYVPDEAYKPIEKYRIFKDDIFISVAGTLGIVGKIPEWLDGANLTENANRLTNITCNRDYLLYYLRSPYIQDVISSEQTIGAQPKLALMRIRNFDIALPKDIAEQRAIASALSDVDGLIAALDKKIAKKRLLKQGAMQQLLTGKKRLPGFTDEWEEITFGEYVDIYRGGSPRPIENYITDNPNGVNWIKIGDVKPNEKYINKTEECIIPDGVSRSRRVYVGDFILSNSMSFGRPYILGIDGCIHDGWLVIQNYHNTFDKDYLYYLLCSEDVMMQYIGMAAGSSVKNLNKEKVASLQLCVPTTIKEQQAIATILSDMDKDIADLEAQRDKYRLLKSGMMQKLLTGQIRLKTE